MTSRTHDLFAFASLLTVASYNPPVSLNLLTGVTCLVGNIVGSLLPDVDQASNRLWDLLPGGDSLGRVFRKLFLAHRTVSHSVLGLFLMAKVLGWLLPKLLNSGFVGINLIYCSIMIGYISHLLLDGFTEEGLPLFWPIPWKIGFPPIASWRIKTGKWFEKLVVFPGIIAYIVFFVSNNGEMVRNLLKLVVK